MVTILYRFLRTHNLTMHTVIDDPFPGGITHSRFTPPAGHEDQKYNLFGEHATFIPDVATALMPPDTKYIASIRYPITQLRSRFNEFSLPRQLHLSAPDPVLEFLEDTAKYSPHSDKLTANFQACMMGYENGKDATEFIEWASKKFSLVIIAEYFDESLILLKRKFCWETKDIVYTQLRSRKYKDKGQPPSEDMVSLHKRFSPVDYILYDYFVEELKRQIGEYGDFQSELNLFKKILHNASIFCDDIIHKININPDDILKFVRDDIHIHFDPSPWGPPFNITALDCALMKLRTRVHRNLQKVRQFPELCRMKIISNAVYADIYWAGNHTLMMNKKFCGELDRSSGIPLDILAWRDSYMWIL